MIRHGLYASLPHREGGGGAGTVASRKQELRRQLRVVRRNPNLIATLFLLQTGLLQIHDDLDFAAALQLHREQARLRTRHLAAQARKLHPPTSKSVICLSKAKDLQVASVTDIASRERPKEANPTFTRRRRLASDGQSVSDQRKRTQQNAPQAHCPDGQSCPCGQHRGTLLARGNRPAMSMFTLIIVVIVVLYILSSIKILREYERAVIFRLGRALPTPKGPGIILVFRPFDQMVRVSLRQEVLEVPPQDIITRDNVTLKVNAVITLRVVDPARRSSRSRTTSTRPRSSRRPPSAPCSAKSSSIELLSHRDALNSRIQTILDQHTEPWGVKVTSVEVKQVDLPESMLRAMAKQAEAEREKRAKIIHAEGEFAASQRLVDAAALLATQPITMQLRYLQTLTEIGVGEEHHHRLPAAHRAHLVVQ